jgi:branched-chain amino acid transport system permease protein
MKNKLLLSTKKVMAHPYFGFILAASLLALVQFLNMIGVPIENSDMRALGQTIIYFIVALGFTLLLGYAGLASLGTAGFVGLGSYVIGHFMRSLGTPFIVALVAGVLIAILLGGAVGFISLRIEGMYLAIITLGLSEILVEIFRNAVSITNGTSGFRLGTYQIFGMTLTTLDREPVYFILVFFLVLAMIATVNLINSPTGRAMLAIKNSDSAGQAMGISLLKYRLLAFVIATVYAVVGGMLYMLYMRFSIPDSWGLGLSLNILAAVIIGGSKSVWGVFIGTFLIFGLDLAILKDITFFQQYPNTTLIFNGLLIIIVVMFYPGGIIRMLQNIKLKIMMLLRQRKERLYGKD